MRKPVRILLLLSLVSVLLVAGMTWRRSAESPSPEALGHSPVPGTSGMLVAIDPETGALTQPSPEQIRALEASKPQPAGSGVQTFVLDDGTVGAHLDERFDHHSTVHIGADGKRHTACRQGDASLCDHSHESGAPAAALPEE